jgi:pimeloyl-ACP methyl ester carboxylesterase
MAAVASRGGDRTMTAPVHRIVRTNGIDMHVVEQGTGPIVVLCHGFPESWYSWRHQIAALAAAGYRVVAPDMRGYGCTDRPPAIEDYTLFHLIGDLVGLLDALGCEQAVVAGHDWGAPVAWHAALLRPDRFRAVIGLSVPFGPRALARPTLAMPQTDEAVFYQLYFQEPGVAEADLERDVRFFLRGILLGNSGDGPLKQLGLPPPGEVGMIPRNGGVLGRMSTLISRSGALPAWLTEQDLDFYAAEFTRTGFRGGLNWYRNIDRNWALRAPFDGLRLRVPALFMIGELDLTLSFAGMAELLPNPARYAPDLRGTIRLPGCGHWTQQERPAEVSAAMIAFLDSL